MTGESMASCHAALRGVPASGGDPEAVAGRWYCAAGDEVMELSAEGSDVVIDGARYRWCSDGRWHGVGTGEGVALEFVLNEMIEVDTVRWGRISV